MYRGIPIKNEIKFSNLGLNMFEFCKKNIVWITIFIVILNLIFCFINGFSKLYLIYIVVVIFSSIIGCFIDLKITDKQYVGNSSLIVLYGSLLSSIISKNVKSETNLLEICLSPVFIVHFLIYKKLDIKKKSSQE